MERKTEHSHLQDFAQKIDPGTAPGITLAQAQLEALRQVATFATSAASRGLIVLFAGTDTAAKSTAAAILARQLHHDLYRVDLAAIAIKHIGETEKHLRNIIDAAAAYNAILFFDQADALFGERSQPKDSHDRYANIEVNYLFQRLAESPIVAIVSATTASTWHPKWLQHFHATLHFPPIY